ncbi:MAG: LnmK family bifunctional acyltransferase/decarboxylase [Pseudomonadota bacterium]
MPFRLGMPHLNATGVSLNWLFRECCHRHWWAVAERAGTVPSDVVDLAGDRVLPSVVCAVSAGRPGEFAEDDLVDLRPVIRPAPETGWRSETVLTSTSGGHLVVELITRFVKQKDGDSATLVPADMPAEFDVKPGAAKARRASLLLAAGRTALEEADDQPPPPHLSFAICPETDMNGVGQMYFANFIDVFGRAERNAIPPMIAKMSMLSREVHYFETADAGETIDVHSEVSLLRLGQASRIQTVSYARRTSDEKIVAICRTTRET